MEKIKASSLITAQHPDYSPRNLKAMRKAMGLTQTEVAKRAGILQSDVSRFEGESDRSIPPTTGQRIANVLVKAEFARVRQSGATPKTEVQKLKERIVHLEALDIVGRRLVKKLEDENAELKKTQQELLSLLGWRIKNVAEDESQRDAEGQLMSKIGAEKLPSVEEDALRSEIQQQAKKGNV